MLPLIQREVSEKKNWIHEEDMLDIVAIAESTPGPIAINTATFVGYRVNGFFGALCATLGTVLPSFVIIIILAGLLGMVNEIRAVRFAFNGVRAGVIALIVKALWGMAKQCPKNLFSAILALCACAVVLFTDFNVLWVILASALIGLASALFCARGGKTQ